MAKATVADLSDLLGQVARELKQRIEGRQVTEFTPEGEELTKTVYASSADLMAALALLKQNSITVDPETSSELKDVQAALEARQRRMRNRQKDPLDALVEELGNGEGES